MWPPETGWQRSVRARARSLDLRAGFVVFEAHISASQVATEGVASRRLEMTDEDRLGDGNKRRKTRGRGGLREVGDTDGALDQALFEGFPYLVTPMARAFSHHLVLPKGDDIALELARQQVAANRLPACLVLAADRGIWFDGNGGELPSHEVPRGGTPFDRELRPVRFERTYDIRRRRAALAEFCIARLTAETLLVGRPELAQRVATPEEIEALGGLRGRHDLELRGSLPGSDDPGLSECQECGEWRGQRLLAENRRIVHEVRCCCGIPNRCARCGQPLADSWLESYCSIHGLIMFVAGYRALAHRCRKQTPSTGRRWRYNRRTPPWVAARTPEIVALWQREARSKEGERLRSLVRPRRRRLPEPPEPPPITPQPLLYGVVPYGEPRLVFLAEDRARELRDMWRALRAPTWGERRRLMPASEVKSWWRENPDRLQAPDDAPCGENHCDDPDWPDDLWASVCDGRYPGWPEQEMLELIPPEIASRFGAQEDSLHDGLFLEIPAATEGEMVQALEEAGFPCRRDDALVLEACGDD